MARGEIRAKSKPKCLQKVRICNERLASWEKHNILQPLQITAVLTLRVAKGGLVLLKAMPLERLPQAEIACYSQCLGKSLLAHLAGQLLEGASIQLTIVRKDIFGAVEGRSTQGEGSAWRIGDRVYDAQMEVCV